MCLSGHSGNPSEPYSDKDILLTRASRRLPGWSRNRTRTPSQFFAYNWKLVAYSWVLVFYLQLCLGVCFFLQLEFFTYNLSCFAYSWSFPAYNGKELQTSTCMDCKQGSSTVSKTTQTVSKKASPHPPWPSCAIPPARLRLSGRNSGKIPERPRKRSQSASWNSP